MNHPIVAKEKICKQLHDMLDRMADEARRAIALAKESRDSDTKSSAGDKYETGREMMQLEMDKNELQLNKATLLKKEISQINLQKDHHKVEFGSLVSTNQGKYFISIGMGKVAIEEEIYYAISLASPIGMLLKNKSAGEKAHFQGKEFIVENVA